MSTSDPATASAVVKHYFDTFLTGDVELTLACLTDDVVWKVQGAADVPTVGIRHGKAATSGS